MSLTIFHFLLNSFITINGVLAQILHVDTKLFVFTDFETTLRPRVGVNEQILNLFIVDLNHRVSHLEALVFSLLISNALKDLRARDRNNSDIGSIPNLRKEKKDLV